MALLCAPDRGSSGCPRQSPAILHCACCRYAGVVAAFDPLRVQHTIAYDDGDIEFVRLWAPDQTVRAALTPALSATKIVS